MTAETRLGPSRRVAEAGVSASRATTHTDVSWIRTPSVVFVLTCPCWSVSQWSKILMRENLASHLRL